MPKKPDGTAAIKIAILAVSRETGNANTSAAVSCGRAMSPTAVAVVTFQSSRNGWAERTRPVRRSATPGAARPISMRHRAKRIPSAGARTTGLVSALHNARIVRQADLSAVSCLPALISTKRSAKGLTMIEPDASATATGTVSGRAKQRGCDRQPDRCKVGKGDGERLQRGVRFGGLPETARKGVPAEVDCQHYEAQNHEQGNLFQQFAAGSRRSRHEQRRRQRKRHDQHVQAVDIPVVDHMQTACPVTDGQDEEDRRESEKN